MGRQYIIFAPKYTHISSGVKALHALCYELNKASQDAELVIMGETYQRDIGDAIVVYPDIVRGNPLGAKNIVRWLLAPAGLYGGDGAFPPTDKIWCYRTEIAKQQNTDKVLCLPVSNPDIFYPSQGERSGTCFYSHKYDRIHGNPLPSIVDGATRLTGTPESIAYILRRSAKCLVFEPTEVIILAAMCGCPCEVVTSDYCPDVNLDPDFFIGGRLIPYHLQMDKFYQQLERFIDDTQDM